MVFFKKEVETIEKNTTVYRSIGKYKIIRQTYHIYNNGKKELIEENEEESENENYFRLMDYLKTLKNNTWDKNLVDKIIDTIKIYKQ